MSLFAKTRGDEAEDRALAYLKRQGLRLEARNYRCRSGEIDLIMHDRDTLVFVEVRFRRSERFGSPAESVTTEKQRRIVSAARHYLQRQVEGREPAARFDVVAITGPAEEAVSWIKDAFWAEG